MNLTVSVSFVWFDLQNWSISHKRSMCGEKIQILVKILSKQLYNVPIRTINGHKLLFSQKEPVQIVAVYCHLNRAHFIQAFQYSQF